LCAGLRLRGRELRDVGLATHYVDSGVLPQLQERLEGMGSAAGNVDAVSNVLREHESATMMTPPPAHSIPGRMPLINAWFGGDSVEAIDAALVAAAGSGTPAAGSGAALAAQLLADMRRASPTALKVAHEAMRRSADGRLSLRECMLMEFRLVCRFMRPGSDFYEGVRAALVDKDGAPRWAPPTLKEVSADAVAAFFAPLPADVPELELGPEPGAPPPSVRAAQPAAEQAPRPRAPRSRM
jgi:enoyl-CoA hydratase/carnithine racemase